MPRAPLLNLNIELQSRTTSHESPRSPVERRKKTWRSYVPLGFAVFLILLPQPSYITVIINHHYTLLHSPATAARHLFASSLITLLAFTSLTICCTRDPGRPRPGDSTETAVPSNGEGDALMKNTEDDESDFNSSKRWCRACWAPKFERTHHCSTCDRCVLKMDHHCPWLADSCVGHRTYPAFVHSLFCVTLLALYLGIVGANTLYYYFTAPFPQNLDDLTPLHALLITLMGMIFSLVLGSFLGYHTYLCATNQTTLESLSPYLLLRYLPPPKLGQRHVPGTSITNTNTNTRTVPPYAEPAAPPPQPKRQSRLITDPTSPYHFPSPPPSPRPSPQEVDHRTQMNRPWEEHELTWEQRRAVRSAHKQVRLYDLGWKANLRSVLGISSMSTSPHDRYGAVSSKFGRWRKWFELFAWGGNGRGNGKTFPMNPKAAKMLKKLSEELEAIKIRADGGGSGPRTYASDSD